MDASEHTDGGGGAVATSLALYRQSSTAPDQPEMDESPGPNLCPSRPPFSWLNRDTGEIVPSRCGRNTCGYCLPKNATRRSAAIALSTPERAFLLTQVGQDWQSVRLGVNRVREYLKRDGTDPGEWCWHVEPNPKGTGHHVHGWQFGKFMRQRALASAADRAGLGGVAFINKVRSVVGASQYGLKGIHEMGYGLKGIQPSEGHDEACSESFPPCKASHGIAPTDYLTLNGKRLTHHTRGFFRSDPSTTLPVRDAERAAMRAAYPQTGPGTWVMIRESLRA